MEGVTVLNTIEGTPIWVAITLIGIIVIALIVLAVMMLNDDGDLFGGYAGGIAVVLVCLMLTFTIETRDRLRVIVDDNVTVNEFMEYYEVLENEGITYIVCERTD